MKNLRKAISVLLSAALLAGTAAAFAGCKKPAEEPTDYEYESTESTTEAPETTEPTTEAPAVVNPLTGKSGYDESEVGARIVGIVVENTPSARPQWGMSTPDIVMEYEVEGGISRMLWLYANADEVPGQVGPVRSARHDIVELALGWDMIFAHCGGSDRALSLLSSYSGRRFEIEAMGYDGCFSRDYSRGVSMEHTLALHGNRLRAAIGALGLRDTANSDFPFSFANENEPRTLSGDTAETLRIQYSQSYRYDFIYNEETGLYGCRLNGYTVADAAGVPCTYTNVLVLYVDMRSMNDSSGHQDLLLENGGTGLYLSGGRQEAVRWSKNGETAPLTVTGEDGENLVLNAGRSYIGLVRSTEAAATRIG